MAMSQPSLARQGTDECVRLQTPYSALCCTAVSVRIIMGKCTGTCCRLDSCKGQE